MLYQRATVWATGRGPGNELPEGDGMRRPVGHCAAWTLLHERSNFSALGALP